MYVVSIYLFILILLDLKILVKSNFFQNVKVKLCINFFINLESFDIKLDFKKKAI